jgi:hypothetical protein
MRPLVLALVCIGSVAAGPAGAELRLDSEPAGVHLRLEGALRLSGTAPLPLDGLPPGEYRLDAGGPGVAEARGHLRIAADGSASARSDRPVTAFLHPPGVAHFREREGSRGWILLTAGGIGGLGAVLAEASRRDAVDDARRAEAAYAGAIGEESIANARLALASARQERDDASEMRTLWGAYFGAVWLGAAVEQVFLTGAPDYRSEDGRLVVDVPAASGAGSALRSALVPGAGQRWIGRRGRANFLAGAVLGLGASAVVAQDAFLDARRDQDDAQRRYDAALTMEDLERRRAALQDAADRADDRSTLRWALTGAAAGAYLWNVLDAWSGGSAASGSAVAKASPLAFSVLPEGAGVEAAVSWRWR